MIRSAILLFLLAWISCTDLEETNYEFSYPEFDFWIEDGNSTDWWKGTVLRRFKAVALGSEFGDQRQVIKKWVRPMRIFVKGAFSEDHNQELTRIIEELNLFFSDGFSISIVTEEDEANFIIYFGDPDDPSLNIPFDRSLLINNTGLFAISFNTRNEIESGSMFVKTSFITNTLQKHILREELTQSLGIANDIPWPVNSIFYEGYSEITELDKVDIEIIRLLYHPAIIPGLGEQSVTNILRSLLRLE